MKEKLIKISMFILILILFSACGRTKYITIKYRDTKVDINNSRWEYLDTSNSSFVEGAWYDDNEEYMIINLNGTYYHYCGMTKSEWESFMDAESFGTYYNYNIKGEYDCRINHVPSY